MEEPRAQMDFHRKGLRTNEGKHKRWSEAWGRAGLGMFGCARREQEIEATVERRQREVQRDS